MSAVWLPNMLPREVVQSPNLEAFKPQLEKAMADLFQCWKWSSFEWEIRKELSRRRFLLFWIWNQLFPQPWKFKIYSYNYMKSWKHEGNLLMLKLEITSVVVLKDSGTWGSLHNKFEHSLSKFLAWLWELAQEKTLWDLILGTLDLTKWRSFLNVSGTIIKTCPSCIILAPVLWGFSKNNSLSNMELLWVQTPSSLSKYVGK